VEASPPSAPGAGRRLREAEINDLGNDLVVFLHEHEIRRFDIAMNQIEFSGGIQGASYLPRDLQRHPRRQRALPLDHSLEGLAIDELHRVEPRIAFSPKVNDGGDVPMPQLCRRARLANEALPGHVDSQERGIDHFQAHWEPKPCIKSLVGDAHRTSAKLEQRAVFASQHLIRPMDGGVSDVSHLGNFVRFCAGRFCRSSPR
jgi:hypothetical protein